MTNLLAYRTIYKDNGEASARLALTIASINPDLDDKNELSTAYAIFDKVTASDYSQGGTSETMSNEARSLLVNKAAGIFLKYEVANPFGKSSPEIDGVQW